MTVSGGAPTVIKVTDGSKRFVIRKEKSLKERLVNFGRSNKHKDDFWALRDIDLDITAGSTVGLIGPNGSGKSTLLKLIGGILQPTTGTVEHRGRLAALLELGAGFHPDLTGRENVYLNASILGLTRRQTDHFFDAIVEFSGIEPFIDTQVKFYSSGMYVRLAFAVAVHVDPDVLLVDEVLAVGDEPFQRKCIDRIREFQDEGRTIVLVTHALDQVADLCDRAVVLEAGRIQVDGDPVEALRHLRADFEALRQDAMSKRSAGPEPGGAAKVSAVRVTDASGAELTSLKPRQDLQVEVDVTVPGVLERPVVGFTVESALGQVVYGTNTKLMSIPVPALSGSACYTFRLPDVALGEGQYGITGTIGHANGAELHRLSHGATVTVYASGRGTGFLDVETTLVDGPGS